MSHAFAHPWSEMASETGSPGAVLVIRLWSESSELRARVTAAHSLDAPGESVVVAGKDEVLACVDRWLDAFGTAQDS